MEEDKYNLEQPSNDRKHRGENLRKLMEPDIRKKQKYKEIFGKELSPDALVKERNKYYSKASRRKHKEYVKELEK